MFKAGDIVKLVAFPERVTAGATHMNEWALRKIQPGKEYTLGYDESGRGVIYVGGWFVNARQFEYADPIDFDAIYDMKG